MIGPAGSGGGGAGRSPTRRLLLVASFAGFAALLPGCTKPLSGLPPPPWNPGPALRVRPLYMCSGEEARIAWEAGGLPSHRDFNLSLSRAPGGLLEVPEPPPRDGSTVFTPREPTDPAGALQTEVTALFSDDSRTIGRTAPAVKLGPDNVHPHLETFTWGCENAPEGGAGYSRVTDFGRAGTIAGPTIQLGRIRNLTTGVRVRIVVEFFPPVFPLVHTETISPGGISSDAFSGNLLINLHSLTAIPEDLDSYGPDGCDSGHAPGEVIQEPGEEPVVVRPRPEITLELQLSCARE